jgi:ankyrin repeat protein
VPPPILTPRALIVLLAQVDDNPEAQAEYYGGAFSALAAAMQAGQTQNIKILLDAGVDPNGTPLIAMSRWSAHHLRFAPRLPSTSMRTRDSVLSELTTPQQHPLTEVELATRCKTRLPFWAGPRNLPLASLKPPILTALELAVERQDMEAVELLLRMNADVAAWVESYDDFPSNPSISFISPSTPLHRAVEVGNLDIIRALLARGFTVDRFPLASINRCLSPLMCSLAKNENGLAMFRLLAASPGVDIGQTSPVFDIHVAHIAAATLSVPSLQAVHALSPLDQIPNTALGHSLLHIACLPFDDNSIQHCSRKVHESIHDIRGCNSDFKLNILWPWKPSSHKLKSRLAFGPLMHDELRLQAETISYLRTVGLTDWRAKDIYGNTPLHYLAANRAAILDQLEHIVPSDHEDIWTAANNFGHSPKDLLESVQAVVAFLAESGQTPENVSYMAHWHDPMGMWLGGKWKSSYPEDD